MKKDINSASAEQDKLSIKRNALLKRKRFVDAVEKLRQNAPENQNLFEMDCNYLIKATGIDNQKRLEELLASIDTEALSVEVDKRGGEFFWRNDRVTINILSNFDNYSQKLRENYHKINKLLNKSKSGRIDFWKITNPFWLIYSLIKKILQFIWQNKLISLLVTLTTFIVADYNVVWKNTLCLWNFIKDFLVNLAEILK